MNREIDRSGLAKLVAEETGINSQTVDAFIKQLFVEVEDKMVDQSLVRLDNLGLFRTIKSGATKRILFLGATKKEESTQKTTKPLISVNEKTDRPAINTEKIKISDITASRINTKPLNVVNLVAEPVSDKQNNKVDEENSKDINKRIEDKEDRENKKEEPVINNTANKTAEDTFSGPVYQSAARNNVYHQQNDKQPKNNKLLIYKIIIGIAAILILALAFFAFFVTPEKEPVSPAGASLYSDFKFEEVANDDIKNISRVIVVDKDVSLRQLAIMYYGDEKFWPYLFKINENIISDGYMIPAQSIVKIPRITVDLVELNTGQLNDKLNSLAEEIALKALYQQ